MDNYECKLLNVDGYRWSMMFSADDFGHAEEQCINALSANDCSVITEIIRDYDPAKDWPENE
jgi:hypothetical protein